MVLLVSMLARGVVRASGVMSPANNPRKGLRRFGLYIEYYIGYQRFRRGSVPNPKPYMTYLRLAGNEGMEKNMEITIVGLYRDNYEDPVLHS